VHGRLCMAQATRLRRTHARSRESGYGSSVNACNGGGVDVLVAGRRAGEDSTPFRAGATWTHYCPQPGGPPPPLTIVNGVARSGKFEGSISPQDFLVMRRPDGNRFDGLLIVRVLSRDGLRGFAATCRSGRRHPNPRPRSTESMSEYQESQ